MYTYLDSNFPIVQFDGAGSGEFLDLNPNVKVLAVGFYMDTKEEKFKYQNNELDYYVMEIAFGIGKVDFSNNIFGDQKYRGDSITDVGFSVNVEYGVFKRVKLPFD